MKCEAYLCWRSSPYREARMPGQRPSLDSETWRRNEAILKTRPSASARKRHPGRKRNLMRQRLRGAVGGNAGAVTKAAHQHLNITLY